MVAQPELEFVFVLDRGKAPTGVLSNQGQVIVASAALPGIGIGLIPKQANLPGHKLAYGGGDRLQTIRHITQIRNDLQQKSKPASVGFAPAAQRQCHLSGREKEELNELFVRVGRGKRSIRLAQVAPLTMAWPSRTFLRGENQ